MSRKRVLSLLMAGVLAVSLMVSSAGAVNINMSTPEGAGKNSIYSGYRLMTLVSSLKSDPAAHAGHDADAPASEHGDDCYNYAYAVNGTYRDALVAAANSLTSEGAEGPNVVVGATDAATDSSILAYIESLTSDINTEPGSAQAFADAVWKRIMTMEADIVTADGESSFKNVDPGYYLIAETKEGDQPDSASLVMLDTANAKDITVDTKESVPSITKKIIDGDADDAGNRVDSVVQGYMEYVHYELTITAPDKNVLDTYEKYEYIVHDAISDGLTFVNDAEHPVEVFTTAGTAIATMSENRYKVTSGLNENCEGPHGCNLEIAFDDVKPELMDGCTIVVRYYCQVNAKAVVGAEGNPNAVNLEFSNNPYGNGKGKTPEDEVIVFALKLVVDKTGQDGETPLSGAGFTLYIKDESADDGWAPYLTDGALDVDGTGAHFEMKGLKKGEYKLVETTVPAGYHKCDDIFFVVTADSTKNMDTDGTAKITNLTVVDQEGNSLTDGDERSFVVKVPDGELGTTVRNYTGNRLPSTGGSGVYFLYVGGAAILVIAVCAAILSKKKKAA